MRASLIFALLLVAFSSSSAQPLLRNFFTTNPAPVVQVTAGTNITVTPSTSGQTRTFLVSGSGGGGTSYWGTNNGILTNIYGNVLFSDLLVGDSSNFISSFVTNSFITGGNSNNIATNANDSAIVAGNMNSIVRRFPSDYANIGTVIVGGMSNLLQGFGSTTVGGEGNAITAAKYSTIMGGFGNRILSEYDFSAIIGGEQNTLDNGADWSAIIAGDFNYVNSCSTGVLIGGQNNAMKDAFGATILGGTHNGITNAFYATILGGQYNAIKNGDNSAIVGGSSNTVNVTGSTFGVVIGKGITNTSNNSIEIGSSDSVKVRFDSVGRTQLGGTDNTTNDLNTGLSAKIANATNDLNTLVKTYTNAIPPSSIATAGTIVTQGFSSALTFSNQFTVDGGIWYSNNVIRLGNTFSNPACFWSNGVWEFRNTAVNGTNVFTIDPTTGAILPTTTGLIALGNSSQKFSTLQTSGGITVGAASTMTSGILGNGPDYQLNSAGLQMVSVGSLRWANSSAFSNNGTDATIDHPVTSGGTLRISSGTGGVKDRYYLNGPVKQLTDNSSVGLITITGRTNDFVGGRITWTIYCASASFVDAQSISGTTSYAGVNTNGVWANLSCVENTSSTASSTTSASTLTRTWAMASAASGGTTNVTISLTADTSLTAAANQMYILWQVVQNSTNAITAL